MSGLETQIVDLLVRHSPPGSGWAYQALADNWYVAQPVLLAILVAIVLGCLALAVEAFG